MERKLGLSFLSPHLRNFGSCVIHFIGPSLDLEYFSFVALGISFAVTTSISTKSTVINIKGESYRLKEKQRAGLIQKTPRDEPSILSDGAIDN
jgi:hypothetical protein